ncbi:AAA family ATPase [Duganella sp. FT134W]|uniref:AAA family ATPase n=1 Tax=Duganella margarita TaxID=2692170 RepID=A0A7X4KIC2_9BURK|nr:AAA family ATPase [Duganella margarita]MYM74514.1 AAA family ATPase [Duganella margarita]
MISRQYVSQVRLKVEEVASFDHYPFSLPAVRHLNTLPLHPKVTFLVGENGSGKSTLLEAIAVAFGFNPEGGTKNFGFNTRASHSELHRYLRLVKGVKQPRDGFFLRAESFFNLATEIERLDQGALGPPVINSYGGKSLHEQSHGESFWSLVMHRFGGNGFYVLDEPEAALSPQRQLALLSRVHQLANENSQFVIATHSPILMAYPDADVYHCSEAGLKRVHYEDTEHFQIMHDFVTNPQRMLDILLSS